MKVLVGAFSGHCETLQRFVDSPMALVQTLTTLILLHLPWPGLHTGRCQWPGCCSRMCDWEVWHRSPAHPGPGPGQPTGKLVPINRLRQLCWDIGTLWTPAETVTRCGGREACNHQSIFLLYREVHWCSFVSPFLTKIGHDHCHCIDAWCSWPFSNLCISGLGCGWCELMSTELSNSSHFNLHNRRPDGATN